MTELELARMAVKEGLKTEEVKITVSRENSSAAGVQVNTKLDHDKEAMIYLIGGINDFTRKDKYIKWRYYFDFKSSQSLNEHIVGLTNKTVGKLQEENKGANIIMCSVTGLVTDKCMYKAWHGVQEVVNHAIHSINQNVNRINRECGQSTLKEKVKLKVAVAGDKSPKAIADAVMSIPSLRQAT